MIINYLLWRLLEFLQVFVYPLHSLPFYLFLDLMESLHEFSSSACWRYWRSPRYRATTCSFKFKEWFLWGPREVKLTFLSVLKWLGTWGCNHGIFCLSASVLIHIQGIPFWFGSHTAFSLEASCFCSGNWQREQRLRFGGFLVMLVVKAMVQVSVIASSSPFFSLVSW